MYAAEDSATGREVPAELASHRRRYRCPRCHADVVLRAGSLRAIHFAHAIGEADPACEAYVSNTASSYGERYRRGAGQELDPTLSSSELLFDMLPGGPRLFLWLPASANYKEWSGTVVFASNRVTRQLSYLHLLRGQTIGFDLLDGQWSIAIEGDISEDYQSLLDLGANSLKSGANIFSGLQSPGRELGPSHAIRLGDIIWVLTRDEAFGHHPASKLVSLANRGRVGGWHIFSVTMPESGTPHHLRQLSEWLKRPVRYARARVWIEKPWPASYTELGIPIYPITPLGIEVRAQEQLDLELRADGGSPFGRRFEGTTAASWQPLTEGIWHLYVNDAPFLTFRAAQSPPSCTCGITVSLNGSEALDMFSAQKRILDLASVGHTQANLLLSWNPPELSEIVRINGVSPSLSPDQSELAVLVRCGDHISAGNLGDCFWSLPEVTTSRINGPIELLSSMRARARWLGSVQLKSARGDCVQIHLPESALRDPNFRLLAAARWPSRFVAHVRSLERDIKTWYDIPESKEGLIYRAFRNPRRA